MATVYLAIQESFQREVALKIMSASLSEDSNFSERFLQEARIVSRLIHPNIVTVHDVGIYEGHHYLSMAYIPGYELKEKLSTLSGAEILRVVMDVARALDYSGKKGYVHRDVKPENILLHEEDGHAVLMDFGIARAADVASSMTMTGMALGTPHYMSPEQARGKAVDPRSDLYSLGVLMYLMFMGAVPYEAETAVAIGIKHISEPIPVLPAPLASFQPVINKLMAKKPENRYQSGAELIKALEGLSPQLIDRWRQQRADKPSGRHNTPVRGVTKPTATGGVASKVRTRPKTKAAVSDTTAAQTFHIPKEDISERNDRQKKSYGSTLLILGLLLVLAGAGLAYKAYTDPASFDQWLVALGLKPAAEAQDAAPEVAAVPSPEMASAPLVPEPETQPVEPQSTLERLLQKSRALAAAVETDPGSLPELTAVYLEVLDLDPDQEEALAGLDKIQQLALRPVLEQFPDGDMDLAEQLMLEALANFPEFANDPVYAELEQRIQEQRGLNEQLARADEYLEQDKLMAPAGENARETYEAVLAVAPDSPRAIAGLENIAIRYHQLAMSAQQRGEYAKAMTLVGRGLSINDDDLALAALADELKEQLNVQQYIDGLLVQAQEFKSKGIWFQAENSAAQRYLQILSLDSGQQQARQGLQSLVNELARQLQMQLELRNLAEAAALLKPAQALLPNNKKLQQLSESLQASQPKVSALVFSGEQEFPEGDVFEAKVKAGRTLYIRFQYNNFKPATTVLQALLFDGGRSVQIAGVPVIVNGEQGSSSFRIDRPVAGFKEGGYHMDILLDGKRIATGEFIVAPYE